MATTTFSKDQMPDGFDERGGLFQKRVFTKALRIKGPFVVETSEGPLRCGDGWLAVDARGYPYPIAADEFDLIYREVEIR